MVLIGHDSGETADDVSWNQQNWPYGEGQNRIEYDGGRGVVGLEVAKYEMEVVIGDGEVDGDDDCSHRADLMAFDV